MPRRMAPAALMAAGFESYDVDFRRATRIYYLTDGDSLVLTTHRVETPVAAAFDAVPIKAAIRASLAGLLGLDAGAVNVKAKTGERVGHVGRGEAIACQTVVLIEPASGSMN